MIENDIFKALADPTRRAIFEKLAPGGMNASALRVGMDISQSAMSQHLAVLRKAGLVREERQGRFVNYEVDPDGLALIAGWLSKYRAYWPARVDALKALLRTWTNERHSRPGHAGRAGRRAGTRIRAGRTPSQVWRAVSIPALREQWLPDVAVSDPEPVSVTHEEEIRYRMRDDAPPFLESLVTFQIEPDGEGGTLLRIIHELADARLERRQRPAANDGGPG